MFQEKSLYFRCLDRTKVLYSIYSIDLYVYIIIIKYFPNTSWNFIWEILSWFIIEPIDLNVFLKTKF